MSLSQFLERQVIFDPRHLDANAVAAFCEQTLPAQRRVEVFAHLAECEACREWLAANAALSGFQWKAPDHGKVRPLGLMNSWQLKAAGAIAALLFLAAMWTRTPIQPASKMPKQVSSMNRVTEAEAPRSPAVGATAPRTITETQVRQPPSTKYLDESRLALWRTELFQPALLTRSSFDNPRPRIPGPLSQARLAKNLNFASSFSIEASMLPALNQIAVQTNLGERWITLDRFGESGGERRF